MRKQRTCRGTTKLREELRFAEVADQWLHVLRAHHEDERLVYLSGVSDSQRDLLERTGVIDIVEPGDAEPGDAAPIAEPDASPEIPDASTRVETATRVVGMGIPDNIPSE